MSPSIFPHPVDTWVTGGHGEMQYPNSLFKERIPTDHRATGTPQQNREGAASDTIAPFKSDGKKHPTGNHSKNWQQWKSTWIMEHDTKNMNGANFNVFICVLCTCTCICVFTWCSASAHVHACMEKLETDFGYLSFHIWIDAVSLTEPGSQCFS